MVVIVTRDDLSETISREIEYQSKRGFRAKQIRLSPEAHESLRLLVKAPSGAVLHEHDGVPVVLQRTLIGPRAFRIIYDRVSPVPEKMIDAARRAG